MKPELISLVGGPFCGRELWLEPSEARAMVLQDSGGEPVVYLLADDGTWRFNTERVTSPRTGDQVCDRIAQLYGEGLLVDLLAHVAVKQTLAGDSTFWQLLAQRVDRTKGESS